MRGKESLHTPTCRNTGITPAYAGKSAYKNRLFLSGRDHPRVCGEKQLAVVVLSLTHRITPAYAGKSRNGKLHADLG